MRDILYGLVIIAVVFWCAKAILPEQYVFPAIIFGPTIIAVVLIILGFQFHY